MLFRLIKVLSDYCTFFDPYLSFLVFLPPFLRYFFCPSPKWTEVRFPTFYLLLLIEKNSPEISFVTGNPSQSRGYFLYPISLVCLSSTMYPPQNNYLLSLKVFYSSSRSTQHFSISFPSIFPMSLSLPVISGVSVTSLTLLEPNKYKYKWYFIQNYKTSLNIIISIVYEKGIRKGNKIKNFLDFG